VGKTIYLLLRILWINHKSLIIDRKNLMLIKEIMEAVEISSGRVLDSKIIS
jgi:hypothetical protein